MDGPEPTFAIYPLLTRSVKVLSTVTLLISGQSSHDFFLGNLANLIVNSYLNSIRLR